MNRENLYKLADFADTIPQDVFDISRYRDGQFITPECDSVGCLLGHATNPFEKYIVRALNGDIDFMEFEASAFGTSITEWKWCFGSDWHDIDNTPRGAAARIRYMLENGAPDWFRTPTKAHVRLYQKYITPA